MIRPALSLLSASAFVTSVLAYPSDQNVHKRALTTSPDVLDGKTFDFVIAGGGLAGLALASRLSEWSNMTVAVIEAGGTGEEADSKDKVDIPGYSYLNSLTDTTYDWAYRTVNQPNAGGKPQPFPRGKVLGGSGATNGMFWCRGSSIEYDAWDTLNPNGAESWSGNEMFKYINKAETFHPPTAAQIAASGVKPDASAHGASGPVQIGFSAFWYNGVYNWIPSWEALGFRSIDGAEGNNRGVTITPSTLNPSNQTRSDSKAAYIDPLPPRSNLVILTGYQVVSVEFNSTAEPAVASGVRFQSSRNGKVYTVKANKEVILSGGTIGSPQILQLSGIGPAKTLAANKIDVVVDLPVGHNLQDHMSNTMYWSTPSGEVTWGTLRDNKAVSDASLTAYRQGNYEESQWTYVNEAIGYISLADIMDDFKDFAANASDWREYNVDKLAADLGLSDAEKKGLMAQYAITDGYLLNDVGQMEILLTMLGSGTEVGIQAAHQHPYTRGTVLVNSASAWDYPTIDPRYYGHEYDVAVTLAGQTWARKLAGASPNKEWMITESDATAGKTGTALMDWARNSVVTEYHILGTCSMLPRDSGGVVDTTLKVYGTKNLRVVDASIMPLQVSAHLMAPTYGIAEKAADIIKKAYAYTPPISSTSSSIRSMTETESSEASSTVSSAIDVTATAATAGIVDAAASSSDGMSTGTKSGIAGGVAGGVVALALLAGLLLWRRRKAHTSATATAEKGWYQSSHPMDQMEPTDAFIGGGASAAGGGYGAAATYAYPRAAFAETAHRDSFNTLDMASAEPMSTEIQYGHNNPLYGPGGLQSSPRM